MQELGKGLLNAFVLLLVFIPYCIKKQRNSVCDTCTKMAALCAGGCFFLYSVQYFKLYAGNFDSNLCGFSIFWFLSFHSMENSVSTFVEIWTVYDFGYMCSRGFSIAFSGASVPDRKDV